MNDKIKTLIPYAIILLAILYFFVGVSDECKACIKERKQFISDVNNYIATNCVGYDNRFLEMYNMSEFDIDYSILENGT